MKNTNLISKIIFFCFVLSLFFPIRHVFLTKEAYLTGDYSDFTSFSLYLSDILLFLLAIFVILPRGEELYHVVKKLKWLILAILLVFVIHFGLNTRLNAYLLAKWLELFVAYGTFVLVFRQKELKELFLKMFAWICGLESIIAIIQFSRQSSIGLSKIGESLIGPNILGVAKIVSGGTTFIRGYGTFPHPNPFSAFLVAGILITTYLLIKSTNNKFATLYSTLLFINILGLTITFSRGAYLALAAGLTTLFGALYFTLRFTEEVIKKRFGFTVIIILLSLIISFFLFKPFLLTRATFSDQSTIERKFYDITGVKMAFKNPIFGIGLGESLLHMEQYLPSTNFLTINDIPSNSKAISVIRQSLNNQKFEAGEGKALAPWDKQPPHNYFILAAAELGVPAMLILVWVFYWHLSELIKKAKSEINNFQLSTFNFLLISIFCSFLLMMMFDHYFYDLEQTQLLLWILLAMIAAEIKTTSPKEERPKTESVVIGRSESIP